MEAVFVELPAFERHRKEYLDDESYRELQQELLKTPTKGDVIQGTGGLRKLRLRGKGKGQRGGFRILYYWYSEGREIWLFLIYSKGEMADITPDQKKQFKQALEQLKAQRAGR